MIVGTPVLDIKPYIPEYDSPDSRSSTNSETCDSDADQPSATFVSPNETNLSKLPEESGIDKGADDADVGNLLSEEKTDADSTSSFHVSAPFSLSKKLSNVLEEVAAYVNQDDMFLTSSESKNHVSDSPKTKPPMLEADHPCYGEDTYTAIASWIREPPVASLHVRFSPHAERELAEFIPTHLSGKVKEFMGDVYLLKGALLHQ